MKSIDSKTLDIIKSSRPSEFEGILYYDETNNYRKFRLTESGMNNNAEYQYYILGGIGVCGSDIFDEDKLNKELNLPLNTEVKFKYFSKGKKDFLDALSSVRFNKLFKFLHEDKKIVFHFSIVNYIYYITIDIIDSALNRYNDANMYYMMHFALKNVLYEIIKENLDDFIKILIKYNFPNIEQQDIRCFCEDVLSFIEMRQNLISNNCIEDFSLEFLRQIIKEMRKEESLIFLKDNEPYSLLENYNMFYINEIITNHKAKLIFDNEPNIEVEINNTCKDLVNYQFVDSKKELLIQVSDAVTGFYSKLLSYCEEIKIDDIPSIVSNMSKKQKDTFRMFEDIIERSNNLSKYLFVNIAPSSTNEKYCLLKELILLWL